MRNCVLPPEVQTPVAVEQASTLGWERNIRGKFAVDENNRVRFNVQNSWLAGSIVTALTHFSARERPTKFARCILFGKPQPDPVVHTRNSNSTFVQQTINMKTKLSLL